MINVSNNKFGKYFYYLFFALTYFFIYFPIIVLVVFSFNSKAFPAPWEKFTLNWYGDLFENSDLWKSFTNSFIISTTATFLCIIMALFMLYLESIKKNGIKKYIPLFYCNLIIPEIVIAISLITYFTMINIPLGMATIIIAHTILGLGLSIPILYIRYNEINSNILEASKTLGATSTQTFLKIIIPIMLPTLISTGLIIFIISFDDFILSYFCSGNSVQTLSLFLVSSIKYGLSPIVNALASILLIPTILLTLVFFYLKNKTRLL